ncbi:Wadjet anti-phage system protein JetD domain-containing protein [Streptomyces sp. 13-12-16]|uniref:Wadjet anti-phage system protein JetD domain-containing protein n=1 Tax=Streptomyces sp. 13-12-16 TaxID=1570823 RepID=UPI0015C41149|nr:Wadjet anti-phage system protein JetD domain-containing protein [Streptomyces sp. 13-12-16]
MPIAAAPTYLAFPDQPHSIGIHGGGCAVTQLSALPWLHDVRLVCWGDLDTHGFTILDRLRRVFPHTQSILMNRRILLEHRGQWAKEDVPAREHLGTLIPNEADVYDSLVDGDGETGGRTSRRLNHGGDRQPDAALYRIVFTRLRFDPRT